MSKRTRLISGVLMGVVIYSVGLFLLPSWGPIDRLIESTIIDSSDVTQTVFLIVSMILMLILSRGRLASFGFRLAKIKAVAQAILFSAILEILLLVLMIASVSLVAPDMGTQEEVGQLTTSFTRTVISVWLIASTCEELFFRGLIYGYLEPLRDHGFRLFKRFISLPVAIAGVMFGLGHLCLLALMPPIVVANIVLATLTCGIVAGYYRETTGSLIPAIVVHMTFNIVGFTIPNLLGAAG